MPITLITGTPGAGKTLFAVKQIFEDLLPTGRDVYSNISGLDASGYENLHIVDKDAPFHWMDYPDGAIFVFDEIQEQYPFKNAMSKAPPYITGYETHRHKGFDFFFITQGPYLIDRHLHPLIQTHYHIYRPFGMKRSTVLMWNGVNAKPEPAQNRSNAIVKNFSFPAKYFDKYKSATKHTVKLRIPWKLIGIFVLLLLGFGFLGYKVYVLSTDSGLLHTDELAEQIVADASSDDAEPSCFYIIGISKDMLKIRVDQQTARIYKKEVVVKTDDNGKQTLNYLESVLCND